MALDVLQTDTRGPYLVAALDDVERKRQERICELLQSEQAYVSDLAKLITFYRDPLLCENVISEEEVRSIFGGIDAIFDINVQLSDALVQRQEAQYPVIQDVSDILLAFFDRAFEPYNLFCQFFKNAMDHIHCLKQQNAEFAKLLAEVGANKAVGPLGLDSYLLKPLQRVTKYPLLISAIIHHTRPSHGSHALMHQALRAAQACVAQINETTRRLDNMAEMFEIQSLLSFSDFQEEPVLPTAGRCLVLCQDVSVDVVTKSSNGKRDTQRLYGFLFNDMLILTKRPRVNPMASNGLRASSEAITSTLSVVSGCPQSPKLVKSQSRRSLSRGQRSGTRRVSTDNHRLPVVHPPLSLGTAAYGTSDGQRLLMLSALDGTMVHIPLTNSQNEGWADVLEGAIANYQQAESLPVPTTRPVAPLATHSSDLLLRPASTYSMSFWQGSAPKEMMAANTSSSSSTSPSSAPDEDCISEKSGTMMSLELAESMDHRLAFAPGALIEKRGSRKHRLSLNILSMLGKARRASHYNQMGTDKGLSQEAMAEIPDTILSLSQGRLTETPALSKGHPQRVGDSREAQRNGRPASWPANVATKTTL